MIIWEAVTALLVGCAVLYLVLEPLVRGVAHDSLPVEAEDLEQTPKGIALSALKEIEFDRETGKLSDADYEMLQAKYTRTALEALRTEDAARAGAAVGTPDDIEARIAARVTALRSASTPMSPGAATCPNCGPRPEVDAVFCSDCGTRVGAAGACASCGAPLAPDGAFCEGCGTRVAA
jgi:hypothetical protein